MDPGARQRPRPPGRTRAGSRRTWSPRRRPRCTWPAPRCTRPVAALGVRWRGTCRPQGSHVTHLPTPGMGPWRVVHSANQIPRWGTKCGRNGGTAPFIGDLGCRDEAASGTGRAKVPVLRGRQGRVRRCSPSRSGQAHKVQSALAKTLTFVQIPGWVFYCPPPKVTG